jgi:DNA-directed RNA polymerase specialized sigma24 family protein
MALRNACRALRDPYPFDAELIGWSVIEDLSLTEVARLAGKNDEATKRAIQRSKKRLRDLIEVAHRADG